MARRTIYTTLAITPKALEALKNMRDDLFPDVTRPTHSDAILKLERMYFNGKNKSSDTRESESSR